MNEVNMDISLENLRKIMPAAGKRASVFLPFLNAAMAKYSINTALRQAAFLAQLAHESGQLVWVKELGSGKAYDTGRLANTLGNTPEADGDGQRYKGRGLIQITGRDNYAKVSMSLDIDCLAHPELLEQPEYACLSAAWFWSEHKLSELADIGTQESFIKITKRINGGTTGLAERLGFYHAAREALDV